MGVIVVTAPAAEPVSLDEVKAHLDIQHTADDALLPIYIAAARQKFERDTRRSLVPRTLRMDLDRFSGPWERIRLTHGPVLAVDSVAYVDDLGDSQIIAAEDYAVDLSSDVARVWPATDERWPVVKTRPGAVSITYVAGYPGIDADPDADPPVEANPVAGVPEEAKAAILMLIGVYYENRSSDAPLPRALQDLLDGMHIPLLR